MSRKAVKLAMITLFLYAMFVQLNDVDPVLWIAVYGYAALVTGLTLFSRRALVPIRLGIAGYTVAIIIVVSGVDAWSFDSERVREAIGVAICLAWMLVLHRLARRP